jgi:hypothetical protein
VVSARVGPWDGRTLEGMEKGEDRSNDEPVEFEEVVAALLQVDPQGIIGVEGKVARKAGRKNPGTDDPSA